MFLSLDGTFWFQLANFAIFYFIVDRVFLRPVSKALAERRAFIDGLKSDTVAFEAEARALRSGAEATLAAARREAAEKVAAARTAASSEAGRISGDYALRATAIADAHRATVAAELEAASSTEGALAASLAEQMIEKAFAFGGIR
jgi:F0F1-type ATP synthase membrane subunit b/b'